MVYITDYTEKGYTVPTQFRDHFDPGRSAITDNNKKFRSFKSEENIHENEVGPYLGFGY